jgi:hypothetical protein
LILAATATDAYEPLSPAEAAAWLDNAPREELIAFVIKYDYIEHAVPDFQDFRWTAILDDAGTVWIQPVYPEGQDFLWWRIGSEETGRLEYRLRLPTMSFAELVPEEKCDTLKWALIAGGAALLVGTTTGIVIGVSLR